MRKLLVATAIIGALGAASPASAACYDRQGRKVDDVNCSHGPASKYSPVPRRDYRYYRSYDDYYYENPRRHRRNRSYRGYRGTPSYRDPGAPSYRERGMPPRQSPPWENSGG